MIGVLADDLSGAAEIGAAGLRHGLLVEILVEGRPSGRADLVCVDTDSRSLGSDEAAARAALAASRLVQAGASRIYKKVDSVLRGRVVQEIEAIMKERALKQALLVPANPSLGRVIREGRYLVRGKPVHKTEFARDPEYPRSSAKVLDLLSHPRWFPICVAGAGEPLAASGITLGEAAAPADLKRWATRCKPNVLAAGGGEFFTAWLSSVKRLRPAASHPGAANVSSRVRELFVCGTTSQSSRDFLSASRAAKIPVFALPSELIRGAEFTAAACEAVTQKVVAAMATHRRVILNIGLPLRRRPQTAHLLRAHLVRLAETVLRRVEVNRVYAEGGATAAALVRRMNWKRLTVVEELAPGVAVLAVDRNPFTLLTIKPGSYLWPIEIRNGPDGPHVTGRDVEAVKRTGQTK